MLDCFVLSNCHNRLTRAILKSIVWFLKTIENYSKTWLWFFSICILEIIQNNWYSTSESTSTSSWSISFTDFVLFTIENSKQNTLNSKIFKLRVQQFNSQKTPTPYNINTLKLWYSEQVRQTLFVHYIE